MFDILEQFFWWTLLIVSVPVLVGLVVAFPIMCEVEMMKDENK